MRLDQYLQKLYPQISRSVIQRLIKNKKAKINDQVRTKSGHEVKAGDLVALEYDIQDTPVDHLDLKILYEDEDCVIINKPVGILTHSKGGLNAEETVATWLKKRANFLFGQELNNRAGIVHRLDRATSGVMICAKNPAALKHLQKQFQLKKAKKTYIARIEGELQPPEALIDLPIERNPKQPSRFRVGQNGKSAQTIYKIIQKIQASATENILSKPDCLVELKPLTGRTHQLRVHLTYLKHPIVGDTFYKGRAAERLFLHAHTLEITLPNKQRKTFRADIPGIFYEREV